MFREGTKPPFLINSKQIGYEGMKKLTIYPTKIFLDIFNVLFGELLKNSHLLPIDVLLQLVIIRENTFLNYAN